MSSAEAARIDAVRSSALWAAYGDALGFISELAPTQAALARRIGGDRIDGLGTWKRRIGGKFGVEHDLPAGVYSDDTQLRLASSRAIRASGRFDVEAFSKIELPVFLSYELGCGRGTRAAASELTKRSVRWLNNFFVSEHASYIESGGNGAAMRIQPHVWASVNYQSETYLPDVFVNSICTHGHARGYVGAAWHARILAHCLEDRSIPDVEKVAELLQGVGQLSELVRAIPLVDEVWLPLWEQRSGRQLEEAIAKAIDEGLSDLARISEVSDGNDMTYRRIVEELGGLEPSSRGSGMKSALFSAVAAWLYRERPNEGLLECVNVLGSDTDTIATMAGALLGAVIREPPPKPVADHAYIATEAERLARVAAGEVVPDFAYPDLLKWTPPKTQLDMIGIAGRGLALAGLGAATEAGQPVPATGRHDAVWQWLRLSHGQSVLVRRRERPRKLSSELLPGSRPNGQPRLEAPGQLFDQVEVKPSVPSVEPRPQRLDLDTATRRAIQSNFDPKLLGQLLLAFADGDGGVDFAVAFAAIVAKARVARRSRPREERRRRTD